MRRLTNEERLELLLWEEHGSGDYLDFVRSFRVMRKKIGMTTKGVIEFLIRCPKDPDRSILN